MDLAHPSCPFSSSVLVLNRCFMAIHVIGVRRAFGLLYRDMAEVIDVENGQYANYDFDSWREISLMRAAERHPHEDWIRTVNFEIKVPRIIRLLSYDRVPVRSLRFNRRNLFARDSHKCQYCGIAVPHSQLSLDHVVPRSRGGKTTWENVVCSCKSCNTKKGGRTPQEARMRLIKRPVKPKHSPLLSVKLTNPKYLTWRAFISASSSAVDLGEN